METLLLRNVLYVYFYIKGFAMQHEDNVTRFEDRFLECDNKFNTIFKLTSAASKIIRSDLTIVKVNNALTELLGYTAQEIEGTKILEHACEEHKAHWHHLQQELWSKKVPFFKLQACLYRKDKALVWVNVTTILFKDQGETFGFTVLDDFSSLKDFEESQRRLNMALKYSKTAVWELDLREQTVFRSEGHDEIFGYQRRQDSWTLASYFPHIWEEDLPKFKKAVSLFSTGHSMDLQLRLVTRDGSVRWVNFQGKTEPNSQGRPVKVLGVINDITRDKLIERHKDDFISIASHELKTPVTILKAYLQLLNRMKEGLSDRVQAVIGQANKSIDKIILLIDDLLNAGKSYQEQLELKKSTFNLTKIVQECCEQVSLSNSHSIMISGPDDLQINADAERIGRVIINMLNNAIKYAPNSKEIKINVQHYSDMAKVSVTDQGPGIPEEKIPLLFDRYYQASHLETQYTGLGLGLFISAEIIKKHNGQIGVESEPQQGSTFWFTLPLY